MSFDVIVIEADGRNAEKDQAVITWLQGKGYEYAGHVIRNDWFVRPGFERRSQPATEAVSSSTVTPAPTASTGTGNSTLIVTRPPWLSDAGVMRRFQTQDTPWEVSTLRTLTQSHAQDAEDVDAYVKYFYGRGGGSFMEMGAVDGDFFSNTYALEREVGWKGIHIEASPSSYDLLVANRPDQVRRSVM